MSVYQLSPPPSIGIPEKTFATWHNGFSEEELERIIQLGESTDSFTAFLADGSTNDTVRKSKTSWIKLTPESEFIYSSLGYIARQLNGQFFDFDIWGFVEDLQYTVYTGDGGHYTWHLDRGENISSSPRKLSLVLQLSDPSEYEGGDLEIFDRPEPLKIDKEKGMVVAFPSFVLHRVTPVTKGIRRTLVVWLSGPKFR